MKMIKIEVAKTQTLLDMISQKKYDLKLKLKNRIF